MSEQERAAQDAESTPDVELSGLDQDRLRELINTGMTTLEDKSGDTEESAPDETESPSPVAAAADAWRDWVMIACTFTKETAHSALPPRPRSMPLS